MELSRVKGLGPTKAEALQAAGITSVEDLAGIDLRKGLTVEGVSHDALKSYKQQARQLLRSEGVAFEKAPYGDGKPRRQGTKAKPKAAKEAAAKRGWFRRILRRK